MEKRWKRRRHGARQRSEHRSRFIRPSQAVRVTDTLFFTADHPDTGRELWQSDGTEAGTALVSDIVAGAGTSSPASLTRVGGTLFFTARHPTLGRELWKVDQSSGAVLVKDINLGPASSEPTRLTAFNDTLYFQAGHRTPAVSCGRVTGLKRARCW
jgi:ELWxxDGT repeat protein